MSKALRASVLLLLLISSAQAGWMPNDVKQPTPPTGVTQEATADGIMPNGESGGLTETILTLLEGVLALF